jgi:hypothetical protein
MLVSTSIDYTFMLALFKKILKHEMLKSFPISLPSVHLSLHPHLFSRAYINFKTNEDILLFRDRFDGYVFIDNKGNHQGKIETDQS